MKEKIIEYLKSYFRGFDSGFYTDRATNILNLRIPNTNLTINDAINEVQRHAKDMSDGDD